MKEIIQSYTHLIEETHKQIGEVSTNTPFHTHRGNGVRVFPSSVVFYHLTVFNRMLCSLNLAEMCETILNRKVSPILHSLFDSDQTSAVIR